MNIHPTERQPRDITRLPTVVGGGTKTEHYSLRQRPRQTHRQWRTSWQSWRNVVCVSVMQNGCDSREVPLMQATSCLLEPVDSGQNGTQLPGGIWHHSAIETFSRHSMPNCNINRSQMQSYRIKLLHFWQSLSYGVSSIKIGFQPPRPHCLDPVYIYPKVGKVRWVGALWLLFKLSKVSQHHWPPIVGGHSCLHVVCYMCEMKRELFRALSGFDGVLSPVCLPHI